MFCYCAEKTIRTRVRLLSILVSLAANGLIAAGSRKFPASSVDLQELGCGLTTGGKVGHPVVAVDFQSDVMRSEGQPVLISEKSCNFQSAMTRTSEQFSGFSLNDVELDLQQAYERDCRKGSVTIFAAVIDHSKTLNFQNQLGVHSTLLNTAQHLSGDFDAIANWRQRIGSELIS